MTLSVLSDNTEGKRKNIVIGKNETKLWLGRRIALTVESPQRLKRPRKIVHAMALFFVYFFGLIVLIAPTEIECTFVTLQE